MNTLTEKSMRTLELHRVLEMLAAQAVSEDAKERSLNLRPSAYPSDALMWQKQTSAARDMINTKSAPPFSGFKDVGESLMRADLGGTLNTRELLDIAHVLRVARGVRSYAASKQGSEGLSGTCLDVMFKLLMGNKYLEDKIFGCIVSEDEIADNASPALADIRRHLRITQNKVRETLNKIVTSPSQTKYLQDSLITQRSGRFVVPVKAEHKADIPGLVHDVSSSGATLFVEPMAVVNLNNELRELEAKEKKEIERILAELSAESAEFKESIQRDYDALIALDCIFARAKLSHLMEANEPIITSNFSLNLIRARHPLISREKVVQISVRLGKDFDTLVITGPNTGGKTVTLKTIGLFSLMTACGLHIPADSGSEAPLWNGVYADIGDEQSIEQSLSTFSSHMTNIVGILETAEENSLILFDELGAGTDPVEGAALAVSIIQNAMARGMKIAATTHYAELKSFAITTEGVENASCEFSVETLKPTYKLLIGIPGKSNAFAISKRLGLPDSIIDAAKGHVSTQNVAFEDVLQRLENQRQALENERIDAQRFLRDAEENQRKSAEIRGILEKDREKSLEKARADAKRLVEETRRESDAIIKELNKMKAEGVSSEAITAVRTKLNQAEKNVGGGIVQSEEAPMPLQRPLVVGDVVELLSIGTRATVLELPDKDGSILLQAGMLRIKAKENEIRLVEQEKVKVKRSESASVSRTGAAPKTELDLRGLATDEAELALDLFVDNAVMCKLSMLRVIHGKGTGAVRAAVHKSLRQNKLVKSFRLGRYGEGEDGVTIVELK